jgi:hypothetical protein
MNSHSSVDEYSVGLVYDAVSIDKTTTEISERLSASIFTAQGVQDDLHRANCGGKIQTLELFAVPERFKLLSLTTRQGLSYEDARCVMNRAFERTNGDLKL